uniref:Calmodulin n=1 Tax=Cacopsylla melanoneura TaxID=428564 RepID=A0A8D8SG57_9HEMI
MVATEVIDPNTNSQKESTSGSDPHIHQVLEQGENNSSDQSSDIQHIKVDLGIDEDQIADLKTTFLLLDKNEDGRVTLEELDNVMRSLGQRLNQRELRELICKMSSPEEGEGDSFQFEEFLRMTMEEMEVVEEEDVLKKAFKVFDQNSDGFISTLEMLNVMNQLGEKLTEQEVDAMLQEADLNGDGVVDYYEFVTVLG